MYSQESASCLKKVRHVLTRKCVMSQESASCLKKVTHICVPPGAAETHGEVSGLGGDEVASRSGVPAVQSGGHEAVPEPGGGGGGEGQYTESWVCNRHHYDYMLKMIN